MQTIACDVCKKKIDEPVSGVTFYYLAEHNICEACKDSLDFQIRPTIRGKDPFAFEWYDKLIGDSIVKAIQKGKI